jgi:hypothetical protein
MWPGYEITGGLPTQLTYVVEHSCARPRTFGHFRFQKAIARIIRTSWFVRGGKANSIKEAAIVDACQTPILGLAHAMVC